LLEQKVVRDEHFQQDYVTSWYLSNHPGSQFFTGLIAARAAADRRNIDLAVHYLDGRTGLRHSQ